MANETKMGSRKNIAIAVVLLALLGIAIWKRETISKALGMSPGALASSSEGSSSSSSLQGNAVNQTIDRNKVLQYGATGASVKELQRLLNVHHEANRNQVQLVPYELLVEDGVFGKKTEALLSHYTQTKSISINQLASKLAIKPA